MGVIIEAKGLRRVFDGRSTGSRRSGRRDVIAVVGIDFKIEAGEVVGFLGPNGAGKTTTLKLLAGLLHPSAGSVTVAGFVPSDRKREYLRSISFIMGQRQQLVWDIPVKDSLELNRVIYRVPPGTFRRSRAELVELLDLGPLLERTARTLSLGERMRCEIAASLVHEPSIVFLDEPTLGLDIAMQRRIRSFVREHNHQRGTTILLTSHYMGDIAELCRRVLLIDHGRLIYDGALTDLRARVSPYKRITVRTTGTAADLSWLAPVVSADRGQVELRVPAEQAPEVLARLLRAEGVADFEVTDPSLEDVIGEIFLGGLPR